MPSRLHIFKTGPDLCNPWRCEQAFKVTDSLSVEPKMFKLRVCLFCHLSQHLFTKSFEFQFCILILPSVVRRPVSKCGCLMRYPRIENLDLFLRNEFGNNARGRCASCTSPSAWFGNGRSPVGTNQGKWVNSEAMQGWLADRRFSVVKGLKVYLAPS